MDPTNHFDHFDDQNAVDAEFAAMVSALGDDTPDDDDPGFAGFRFDGTAVVFDLPEHLLAVLEEVVTQQRTAMVDDVLLPPRLNPVVYTDDVAAQYDYIERHGSELRERRVTACDRVLSSLHDGRIDAAAAECWLQVLNQFRLLLTDGVTTDEELEGLYSHGDPSTVRMLVLFGWLQSRLLDELQRAGW